MQTLSGTPMACLRMCRTPKVKIGLDWGAQRESKLFQHQLWQKPRSSNFKNHFAHYDSPVFDGKSITVMLNLCRFRKKITIKTHCCVWSNFLQILISLLKIWKESAKILTYRRKCNAPRNPCICVFLRAPGRISRWPFWHIFSFLFSLTVLLAVKIR